MVNKSIPQGDDEGLLTAEEMNCIVENAMNEDSAVYIAVNRGHWERIAPLLLKAQQALTRQEINIPKDMMAWILKRLNGKDASEFMLAISVGKPLKEGLGGK